MKIDLAELKKLAESAASGPWQECGHAREGCVCCQIWSTTDDAVVAVAMSTKDEMYTLGEGYMPDKAKANAKYIAAANPVVVLFLLKEIEELEEYKWMYQKLCD